MGNQREKFLMLNMLAKTSLLALFGIFSVQSCPTGFVDPGSASKNCYGISVEKMDLGTAQEYCWINGGQLAEFSSINEEIAVEQILLRDVSYWIGLSDFSHEGTWRWQESHDIPSYTNWQPGQPNGGTSQNCAMKTFFKNEHGKWHDVACTIDAT